MSPQLLTAINNFSITKQLANDKQAAQNAQQMLESAQQIMIMLLLPKKQLKKRLTKLKLLSKAQQAVTTAQANADAAQQKVATAKADALKALETYNNYKNDNGVPTVKTQAILFNSMKATLTVSLQ